jgi:uncharacterized protein YdeI (YjbR/CyaY-like superfamily)
MCIIQLSRKAIKLLEVRTPQQWRNWLQEHQSSESEVWLVFHKRHRGSEGISYDDSVKQALCFGWIDSIVRRLDDDRYARKFTPRKRDSRWSTINRRRYAHLKARGLLTASGLERAPTSRNGDVPQPSVSVTPQCIEKRLKSNARAWEYFKLLAPSYQRTYIGWIDSAKRKETKERRLREAVNSMAAGKKLGLK